MWSAPLRSVMWRKPSSMYVAMSDMSAASERVECGARDRRLGCAESRIDRQRAVEIGARIRDVAQGALDHAGVVEQLRVLGVLCERVLHRCVRVEVSPLSMQAPGKEVITVHVVPCPHLDASFGKHALHVPLCSVIEQEQSPRAMNGARLLECTRGHC